MKRILTISSNPEQISWLLDAPPLQDYEIVIARGEADALKLLRQKFFGVVITNPHTLFEYDLVLHDEMRRIRPGLRTIILSPEAAPADVVEAIREHVFACFNVPFDREEVIDMVKRAIESPGWRDGIEVLSASNEWIALRVTCSLLSAERLVHFMDELMADHPDQRRSDLITAFREILLNAMEYGAGFDPEKVIDVCAVRTERGQCYYFRDPGTGFHRDVLPHAAVSNAPENPIGHIAYREEVGLRPGGFGLMLTGQLVDEIIYNEIGNEVLLIKHTA